MPLCPYGTTLKKGTCVRKKINPSKYKDIRQLLIMTGSTKLAMQSVEQLIKSYKTILPQVPMSFWAKFQKKFNEETLITLIIPAYDKHLTHKDVRALIAFYKSNVGKKYIKVMPDIQRDAQQMGQQWGLMISQTIEAQLKKEGYLKK